MKKLRLNKPIFLLLFLLACNFCSAQIDFQNYYNNGTYLFDDENKIFVNDLFSTYKAEFGLGTYDEMELLNDGEIVVDSTDTVNIGNVMTRYRQKYKGYLVEGKSLSVHSKCGVALAVTGSVLPELDIVDTDLILEENALDTLLDSINAQYGYIWDNDSAEFDIKEETGDTNATNYPVGELVVVKKFGTTYEDVAENYMLCWKFYVSYYDTVTVDSVYVDTTFMSVHTDTPLLHRVAYINAHTGAVEALYDHGMASSYLANQWTWYYGYKTGEMVTYKRCPTCDYMLNDNVNKIYGVLAYKNMNTYVKDNNNNWVEDDTKTAAQGHWAATRSHIYFLIKHGANFNGVKIHYYNYDLWARGSNAIWYENFGKNAISIRPDVKISGYPSSAATLDIIGHEITHGLINQSSQVSFKTSLYLNDLVAVGRVRLFACKEPIFIGCRKTFWG